MNLFCFLQENILGQSRFIFLKEVPKTPEVPPPISEPRQNTVEGITGEAEWKLYEATAEKCVKNKLMSQAAVDRWRANPSFFSKENLVNAIHWDAFATQYVDNNTGRVDIRRVDKGLGVFFIGLMKEVKTGLSVLTERAQFVEIPRFVTIASYTFDVRNPSFFDKVESYALDNRVNFLVAAEQIVQKGYIKR